MRDIILYARQLIHIGPYMPHTELKKDFHHSNRVAIGNMSKLKQNI